METGALLEGSLVAWHLIQFFSLNVQPFLIPPIRSQSFNSDTGVDDSAMLGIEMICNVCFQLHTRQERFFLSFALATSSALTRYHLRPSSTTVEWLCDKRSSCSWRRCLDVRSHALLTASFAYLGCHPSCASEIQ